MDGSGAEAEAAEKQERRQQIIDSLVASLSALDLADPEASQLFIDAIRRQREEWGLGVKWVRVCGLCFLSVHLHI